jgi:hypothetical protein
MALLDCRQPSSSSFLPSCRHFPLLVVVFPLLVVASPPCCVFPPCCIVSPFLLVVFFPLPPRRVVPPRCIWPSFFVRLSLRRALHCEVHQRWAMGGFGWAAVVRFGVRYGGVLLACSFALGFAIPASFRPRRSSLCWRYESSLSLDRSSLQSSWYSCRNPPESGRFREFRGIKF